MKYLPIITGVIVSVSNILCARVIPIEKQNTFESIASQAVIMFTTPTCGPCQLVKPEYNALSNNPVYSNIVFYMLDLDPNRMRIYQQISPIAAQFNIRGYPTFLFLSDGKEVARIIVGEAEFQNKMEDTLARTFGKMPSQETLKNTAATPAQPRIKRYQRKRRKRNRVY